MIGLGFPLDQMLTNVTAYNEALLDCQEEFSKTDGETRKLFGIGPDRTEEDVCKYIFRLMYPESKVRYDTRDSKEGDNSEVGSSKATFIWPIDIEYEKEKEMKRIDRLYRRDAKDKFEAGLVDCALQSTPNSTVSNTNSKNLFGTCVKGITDEYSTKLISFEKSKSDLEMDFPDRTTVNPKDSVREREYKRLQNNFLECRLHFLGGTPLTTTKDGKQANDNFQDCVGFSTELYVRVLDWISYKLILRYLLPGGDLGAQNGSLGAQKSNSTGTNLTINNSTAHNSTTHKLTTHNSTTHNSTAKHSTANHSITNHSTTNNSTMENHNTTRISAPISLSAVQTVPLSGQAPAVLKRIDDMLDGEEYRAYIALIPNIKDGKVL